MKKLLHIFLSFLIVYFTTYSAYANTSFGGWTLTDSLIAGANTTINATKTAGGIALESSVKVGASAAKVGGKLIKGGGYVAIALAVTQIVGDSIDWVLDPDNNAVRYSVPADPDVGGYGQYLYGFPDYPHNVPYIYSNPTAVLEIMCSYADGTFLYVLPDDPYRAKCKRSNGSVYSSDSVKSIPNPDYNNPPDLEEYKYIPIETVAAKVISNAEAGHGPSQDVVEAVALEGFAEGELDPALNAAANVVGSNAGTDNPADTADPADPADPTDPTAPADPIDYTSFLSAIKALLVGVLTATSDFFDWGKQQWAEFATTFGALNDWVFEEDSPTDSDNTIDPTIPPVVPVQVAIDFVGGCPAPLTFDFNFYGQNYKPGIPFTPICEVAILINPIIHICATIAAAYIVAGIRQGGT